MLSNCMARLQRFRNKEQKACKIGEDRQRLERIKRKMISKVGDRGFRGLSLGTNWGESRVQARPVPLLSLSEVLRADCITEECGRSSTPIKP